MVIISDTFTDTAGVNLLAHTPEVGGVPLASVGSSATGAVITAANRVRGNATGDNVYYYPAKQVQDVSFAATYYCASNSDQIALVARLDPVTNTYIRWKYIAALGQFSLQIVVNGSPSGGGSTHSLTLTPGQSYSITFSVIGSTILGSVDSTQILAIVDSTITAAGYAGLYFNSNSVDDTTGIHIDNLSASEMVQELDGTFDTQLMLASASDSQLMLASTVDTDTL